MYGKQRRELLLIQNHTGTLLTDSHSRLISARLHVVEAKIGENHKTTHQLPKAKLQKVRRVVFAFIRKKESRSPSIPQPLIGAKSKYACSWTCIVHYRGTTENIAIFGTKEISGYCDLSVLWWYKVILLLWLILWLSGGQNLKSFWILVSEVLTTERQNLRWTMFNELLVLPSASW